MRRNILIPLMAAICFDLLSGAAIYIKAYISNQCSLTFGEIYFSTPICYFWLLWSALIYFSAYGLMKDYHNMLNLAYANYPSVQPESIKTYVTFKYMEKYSKMLILPFMLLPLFQQFISTSSSLSGNILVGIAFLIPGVVLIAIYFISKYKNETIKINMKE